MRLRTAVEFAVQTRHRGQGRLLADFWNRPGQPEMEMWVGGQPTMLRYGPQIFVPGPDGAEHSLPSLMLLESLSLRPRNPNPVSNRLALQAERVCHGRDWISPRPNAEWISLRFDQKEENPEKTLPKVAEDRGMGQYIFRNQWKDENDIIVAVDYSKASGADGSKVAIGGQTLSYDGKRVVSGSVARSRGRPRRSSPSVPVNSGRRWTRETTLGKTSGAVAACLPVDLSGDGRLDLLVLSDGGDRLFRLSRDEHWSDITAGATLTTRSRQATVGDLDGDGKLQAPSFKLKIEASSLKLQAASSKL